MWQNEVLKLLVCKCVVALSLFCEITSKDTGSSCVMRTSAKVLKNKGKEAVMSFMCL